VAARKVWQPRDNVGRGARLLDGWKGWILEGTGRRIPRSKVIGPRRWSALDGIGCGLPQAQWPGRPVSGMVLSNPRDRQIFAAGASDG
jgi:hypothetical protein